ncbi:MAG: DUF4382 domain-containing protein [Gammaproteobacteria bacterium]
MRTQLLFGLVASMCLTLAGCGGGSGSGSGKLSVGMTDAPIDGAQKVVIHVTSATLHGPDGNTTYDVMDSTTGTPGRDIDLLKFQGGQWTGLFDATVTAGHYSWIRLGIDQSKSYIQINDTKYGLTCPSCDNTGYKINTSFNVAKDATLTMMLDFDLRKSITDPNGSNPDYILRPTVRLVDAAASGSISGSVDGTLLSSLLPSSGGMCSVYVFAGLDATPDDIYIPTSSPIPSTQNNPVTTANVTGTGPYTYTAAFLPAGDYTLAVTCMASSDSAATKETLSFSYTQNATVAAGATTTLDFPATQPPTTP